MDVWRWCSGRANATFGSIDGQHLLEAPHVVIQATGCYT